MTIEKQSEIRNVCICNLHPNQHFPVQSQQLKYQIILPVFLSYFPEVYLGSSQTPITMLSLEKKDSSEMFKRVLFTPLSFSLSFF